MRDFHAYICVALVSRASMARELGETSELELIRRASLLCDCYGSIAFRFPKRSSHTQQYKFTDSFIIFFSEKRLLLGNFSVCAQHLTQMLLQNTLESIWRGGVIHQVTGIAVTLPAQGTAMGRYGAPQVSVFVLLY